MKKYGDPIKHKRKVKNIITAVGALAIGAAATAGTVKIGRMVLDKLASDPDFRDKWGNVEVWRNMNDQGQRAFKNVMEDVIFKNTSKPPIHGVPVPQYNMLRNGPRLSAQRGPLRLTKNRRRTFQDYIDGTY